MENRCLARHHPDMCSRYQMDGSPRELAERFNLGETPIPPDETEVRPTNRALVIRRREKDSPALAEGLRWGVIPDWSDKPLINARSETLAEKPSFARLVNRRCLVPATAWIEWRRVGAVRRLNRLAPRAGGLFAFAGLEDGSSFTIVTCPPAPAIAHVHGRMPVVLARGAEAAWLDDGLPFAEVAGALRPFESVEAEEEAAVQGDLFG